MIHKEDPSKGEIVLYATEDGQTHVECRLRDETIWLTQQQIADLFGVDKSGVRRHLKSIYDEGELVRDSVVAKIATTAADGKTYQVEYYSLDAIIAIGYRVNSYQATQFRIWATNTLKEFIVKSIRVNPCLSVAKKEATDKHGSTRIKYLNQITKTDELSFLCIFLNLNFFTDRSAPCRFPSLSYSQSSSHYRQQS